MKPKKTRSSASQITWYYSFVLAFITVLMGVSLALVVGYQLTNAKVKDADSLMDSLQRSFIDDRPDWNHWRESSAIDTHDTFVKVHFQKNAKEHVYYSPNTRRFLAKNTDKIPFFNSFEIRGSWRPYYHVSSTSKGIHYEIWVGFHNVTHMFKLIFYTVLMVMVLSFLLGSWLISILANRLNLPLRHLTKATHVINRQSELTDDTQLPVPNNPEEVHDLTQEFNQLLSKLNQQVKRDHQFVSDASHELRTPITAIRGHVQFIQRHGKDHPEIVERSLGFIDSESLRMQHLILELLKLSRLDKVDVEMAKIDLVPVLNELVAGYQESIPQNIQLETDTSVLTLINSDNFEQIIVALLNNASKYSDKTSNILIKLHQTATNIKLQVIDSGIGIPDDQKDKVFDRFYRVDKARTQKIPGTGLGLAIVKRLADLNKIKLQVSDNQPQGTIFTLYLNNYQF